MIVATIFNRGHRYQVHKVGHGEYAYSAVIENADGASEGISPRTPGYGEPRCTLLQAMDAVCRHIDATERTIAQVDQFFSDLRRSSWARQIRSC